MYVKASIFLFVIFLYGCGQEGIQIKHNDALSHAPISQINQGAFIREWVLIGPFPNPEVTEPLPDGSLHIGYYKDYLQSLGGEAKAVITTDTTVTFSDQEGQSQTALAQKFRTGDNGIVDLDKVYNHTDNKVAYAFCHILSEETQPMVFLLGSDDGVKVWINGKLVHKNYVGRGLRPREDTFKAQLQKGLNTILVKVYDLSREWGLVLEVLDEENYASIQAEQQAKEDLKEFLNCRLVPKVGNPWDYTFAQGKFPEIEWDRPYLVEKVMGKFPLQIRWFDSQLNEVSEPTKPGRYAFYAEGTTDQGKRIRRAATLFCRPQEWFGWSERPKAYLEYLPVPGIDKSTWQEHREAIAAYAGRQVLLSILSQQEGAILMSYLDEIETTGQKPALTDTPIIRDHDYHLALKRKLLGCEDKWPSLKLPRKLEGPAATVLHEGSESQAGVKPGTTEKIRQVCEQWYDKSGEPFVVLVARHGVIIIHEAFGEGPQGKVDLDTATEMASVTKLVTGVMFAQFVDQGIIKIDDKVGQFLEDFPLKGDKAITLRHCFTHTTGMSGHEEWGGLHNPWLENVITNGLDQLDVGKVHIYNGMGYDLAGRVMELVSGKSIFRLMRENFFDPLGLGHTVLEEDLGFSTHSTAGDFARIGQLLLNRGAYGDLEYFSPDVFEKLLPQPLKQYYPEINNVEWGIGLTWMRQTHPDSGKNGVPKDKTILSKNVIGHGSATSAILRVDLDNDLVISQTRRIAGKSYNEFLVKFLLAIDEGLIEQSK